MDDKLKNFLLKLQEKERLMLLIIFADIETLKIEDYKIKPLKKFEIFFTLIKNNFKITFHKEKNTGIIVDVQMVGAGGLEPSTLSV